MGVLVEGLVQVQLAGGDVAQHAQSGHVHVALREAEQVYAYLRWGEPEL